MLLLVTLHLSPRRIQKACLFSLPRSEIVPLRSPLHSLSTLVSLDDCSRLRGRLWCPLLVFELDMALLRHSSDL